MKPILVTGASGLLGRAIVNELRVAGFAVRGIAYTRTGPGLDRLDLCDLQALRNYIDAVQPGIIFHAAAERHPDVSEKDPAATRRLNVEVTRAIAESAHSLGACVCYISTDYVFDGKQPPYRPDAATNPLNVYGLSKRDGELAVRDALDDHIILRVPILYGPVETLAESPVTTVAVDLLRRRGQRVEMDQWAVRYPTLTTDVAVVCRQIVESRKRNAGLKGTFHWSGNEPMTKFDMAHRIARLIGFPETDLVPNSTPSGGAVRPRDCHLDCRDLEAYGIGQRTAFDKAMPDILKPHTQTSKS